MLCSEDTPGGALADEALEQFIRDPCLGPPCLLHLPDRPDRARRRFGPAIFAFTEHAGLRVVDASVFPRIPGFFIVCAIYMIAEKAADAILAAASNAAGGD